MKNILTKICDDKKIFIENEKKKKSINFLIKNTSKKKRVKDFKKAFDKKLLKGKVPVISEIKRVSRPGRRVYFGLRDLPRVYNGLGIAILSTPRGVLSDNEARTAKVGGEVLCHVF